MPREFLLLDDYPEGEEDVYDSLSDDWSEPDQHPAPKDKPTIIDHRYDCGPSEETGGPCWHQPQGEVSCGQPRSAHALTEYDTPSWVSSVFAGQNVYVANEQRFGAPGDMHEPPAYPKTSLSYDDDHLHPFFD